MTAAKPEEANHNERTTDAAPLSRWQLQPQLLLFMLSFTNENKWSENSFDNCNKYTKKEMKTSTLILKLTNMILATANNPTDEITATISSGNPFFTVHEWS